MNLADSIVSSRKPIVNMADSRDPPPFEESQENDDLFKSALDTTTKEELTRNGIDELMSGGGEEVSLEEDEDQPQTTEAKLEFQKSPEQETVTPPAQMSLSQTTKEEASSVAAAEEGGLEINVVEPQRVGDGMGAYVVYKVETRTTLPYFSRKAFSVARRFSDFLGLHARLQAKHLHLGRIVPPPPSKDIIGTTKVKMSKDSEAGSSSDFVERRRVSLERYLRRVGAHPVLRTDPDFREFLELGEDLPRARGTQALSSAGVLRLFSRVGDSVAKMAFLRMDEADTWFEEKQHQIENLDQQLRKLHASVESLVMHRKELAGNTGSLGRSIASLGTCEEHTALSRALSQLSEVHERLEQLHAKQANSDFFQLAELIKDYVTLIAAVKEVFGQRVKVYQTWQHAQQVLTKKREQKAKLELASKHDKLPQAKEEVIEWEAKCERGQEEFENISKMIRKEVERFERSRVHDFKLSIVRYMEALLDSQQQLIKHWESFLPEAKAIA